MDLGKLIATGLKDKGWTLSYLARRSGVAKSTLHGWLTGRRPQGFEQPFKVLRTLNVSLDQIG